MKYSISGCRNVTGGVPIMSKSRMNIDRSLVFAVLFLAAGVATAQNNITNMWNQTGGTHNWIDSANWTNAAAYPDGTNALAILTNNITSSQIINLNQAISVANLWLGDRNGDAAFTIAAGTGGSLSLGRPLANGLEMNKYGTNTDVITAVVSNNTTINNIYYIRAINTGGKLVFSNAVYGGAGYLKTEGNYGTIEFAGTGNNFSSAQTFMAYGYGLVLVTGRGKAADVKIQSYMTVLGGVFTNAGATSIGQWNVAGTLTVDGGSYIGSNGTWVGCIGTERAGLGTLVVTNGGLYTAAGGGVKLYGSNTASFVATVTLAGGAGVLDVKTNIATFLTMADATNNFFNFNGGKLRYSHVTADQPQFLSSNIQVRVMDGGAEIEVATAGRTIAISNSMQHAGAAATDGGLTKSGAGILILSGTNTYTGATIISNGVLSVTQTECLGTNTDVQLFSSAGTLNLNFTGTNTVHSLSVDGRTRGAGIYGASRISQITGTGYLRTTWPPLQGTVIMMW